MNMAFFCANFVTRLASDTIIRIGDRHYLVAHVVTVLVVTFERFYYQLQYIAPANFVATSAAYTFIDIYRI
jgi:hypothetical protein